MLFVKKKKAVVELDSEDYVTRLRKALDGMDGKCTVCLVQMPADTSEHTHLANRCSGVNFNQYVKWKKNICYKSDVHGPVCSCCHVPQIDNNLHKWISPGKSAISECPYPDHTLFLTYAVYHHTHARQAAEAKFKFIWPSDVEYVRWLCDICVEKSKTNTMCLILWFIEEYLPRSW